MNFYLTFGQQSPARNGYILVKAKSYDEANAMVRDKYDQQWSMLYNDEDFKPDYFPAGCIGEMGS